MNLQYIKGNIFENEIELTEDVVYAHCVSADAKMGAGIAKQFVGIWGESLRIQVKRGVDSLKELCESIKDEMDDEITPEDLMVGTAVAYQNENGVVYNLITKLKYWQRVGKGLDEDDYLENLSDCLNDLRTQMESHNEEVLLMPRIGSGLDRCSWSRVEQVIIDNFEDSDIDIYVFELE